MIIGSMTLLSKQFSLQYSFSVLTTCPSAFVKKKTPIVYKTDKIANLHGHEVIRTPIRHCELNPINMGASQRFRG
jgi:hypothetical protein